MPVPDQGFRLKCGYARQLKEQHLLAILACTRYLYHPHWQATPQPPFWLSVTPICQVTHHLGQQWPLGGGRAVVSTPSMTSASAGLHALSPTSCFPLCRENTCIKTWIYCVQTHICTFLYDIPVHVCVAVVVWGRSSVSPSPDLHLSDTETAAVKAGPPAG